MFFAFFIKGRRMELYEVTTEYVEYLRTYEPTKVLSNSEKKSSRKFLGIVVQKNGYQYVVPLSSPKYKKDYEIEGYTADIAYKTLLNKQIQYLRKNQKQIINKHMNPVYINRKKNRMDIGYIKNATPDFALLEKKCTEWEIKKNS